MKLMTAAIKNKLPALYATDGTDLPSRKVMAKFFTPDSGWTWYVVEGNPHDDGDYTFFGLVHGFESEWGYFQLSDLQKVRGSFGLPIERDRGWDAGKYTVADIRPAIES